MEIKDKVLEYLENNKEKWILGKEICNEYNVTPIHLRALIQMLRLEGKLIVASHEGYMLTTDKVEIWRYLESREQELNKERKVIDSMRGSYADLRS